MKKKKIPDPKTDILEIAGMLLDNILMTTVWLHLNGKMDKPTHAKMLSGINDARRKLAKLKGARS